jgi:hypothetical protein
MVDRGTDFENEKLEYIRDTERQKITDGTCSEQGKEPEGNGENMLG